MTTTGAGRKGLPYNWCDALGTMPDEQVAELYRLPVALVARTRSANEIDAYDKARTETQRLEDQRLDMDRRVLAFLDEQWAAVSPGAIAKGIGHPSASAVGLSLRRLRLGGKAICVGGDGRGSTPWVWVSADPDTRGDL